MAKDTTNTPKHTKAIFDKMVKAFVAPKPKEKVFKRGDILWGGKGKLKHALIFWGIGIGEDMIGIMLTKPKIEYDNNVSLSKIHIKEGFEFKFEKTEFLNAQLIKKAEWGKYRKAGELTGEGVDFVAMHVADKIPVYWWDIPTFK